MHARHQGIEEGKQGKQRRNANKANKASKARKQQASKETKKLRNIWPGGMSGAPELSPLSMESPEVNRRVFEINFLTNFSGELFQPQLTSGRVSRAPLKTVYTRREGDEGG